MSETHPSEKLFTWQSRKQMSDGDTWNTITQQESVLPSQGAVIICDMWDCHWCKGATKRVGELAGPLNDFVKFMRDQGFLIVHCPSNTMGYYADHPARKRILTAEKAPADPPLADWCYLNPERESALPFDDSDGGCYCGNGCSYHRPYTHENDMIYIDENRDVIGDGLEVYYYFRRMGIRKVFYCGVHANICIPGRMFGIRQMTYQGIDCVLVQDLIDVMYNPAMPPYIDHFDAVDRMAEHMQRYWCTSVRSSDLMGGEPFRFQEDTRE